jgi:hypothetical protein
MDQLQIWFLEKRAPIKKREKREEKSSKAHSEGIRRCRVPVPGGYLPANESCAEPG